MWLWFSQANFVIDKEFTSSHRRIVRILCQIHFYWFFLLPTYKFKRSQFRSIIVNKKKMKSWERKNKVPFFWCDMFERSCFFVIFQPKCRRILPLLWHSIQLALELELEGKSNICCWKGTGLETTFKLCCAYSKKRSLNSSSLSTFSSLRLLPLFFAV